MKTRREFIKQSMAVSAGFAGLSFYLSGCHFPQEKKLKEVNKWLELPEEFNAGIISKWGDKMDDGFFVPGRADGMAAFEVNGKVVVIRNHENSQSPTEFGPFGDDMSLMKRLTSDQFFDYGFGKTPGLGGTTTMIFDEEAQKVEKQFLSLIGTNRNCAGGATPWGIKLFDMFRWACRRIDERRYSSPIIVPNQEDLYVLHKYHHSYLAGILLLSLQYLLLQGSYGYIQL